jgi:hypothetical protein
MPALQHSLALPRGCDASAPIPGPAAGHARCIRSAVAASRRGTEFRKQS